MAIPSTKKIYNGYEATLIEDASILQTVTKPDERALSNGDDIEATSDASNLVTVTEPFERTLENGYDSSVIVNANDLPEGNGEKRAILNGYDAKIVSPVMFLDSTSSIIPPNRTLSNGYDAEIIASADGYWLPLNNSLLPNIGDVIPSFSRSTTATVVDFEGVVNTAKINETRFTGARRVENLLEFSEDFGNVYWEKTDVTVETNNTIDPNGNQTADKIVENTDNADHFVRVRNLDYGIGITYALSCYAKRNGRNFIRLAFPSSAFPTNERFAYFDLLNGVVGTVAPNVSATIEDIGNDWYRCVISRQATISTSIGQAFITVCDQDNNTTYTGDGSSGIFVWGAQLEQATGTQTTASEYVSTGVSVRTGEEEVTNGGFDTDSDWRFVGDANISGGTANFNATGSFVIQDNAIPLVATSYRISYEIVSGNGSQLRFAGGNSAFGTIVIPSSVGIHEIILPSNGTQSSIQFNSNSFIGSIDNVSVKQEFFHGANVDGVRYFETDRSNNLIDAVTVKGYLNEAQGTNDVVYSEDFGTTWINGGVTLTTNNTSSPDGSQTADRIAQIDSPSGDNIRQFRTISASTDYTYSVFVKNIDSTQTRLFVFDTNASASLANLLVTWTGNTPSTSSSTGASNIRYEELQDDWWRVSFSFTTAATVTTHGFYIYPESLATATNAIYAWGVQVEQSQFPTSYIKTEGTTVTRTADSMTVDNTARDVLPNSFTFAGTWSPLGAGADYNNVARLFGSQDSRGNMYEQATRTSTVYNYTPETGGGLWRIDEADVNRVIFNKYAFQVRQDGSNAAAKVYKDGISKLNTSMAQTLDHSNQSLEIGSWAGTVFSSNIKNLFIGNGTESDGFLETATESIYLQDESGNIIFDENNNAIEKD